MRSKHQAVIVAGVVLSACAGYLIASQQSASSGWVDPVSAPAERLPKASQALLLDAARWDDRIIVAGERGNILRSNDSTTWEQVDVPTRATLTAISTSGDRVWAVGHDGIILRSDDRGATWVIQRSDPLDATKSAAQRDASQGAPLLDVLFIDEDHGFAIGAYNQMLVTRDGGHSWAPFALQQQATNPMVDATALADKKTAQPAADDSERYAFNADELELGEESDPHLNAIVRTGSGGLFIVSERGSAYRSRDQGSSWQRLQLPYEGSMFGVIGYEGEHVLAFGLRGHVFESLDLGDTWKKVESGTEFSLIGGAGLADGGAVLVGANGTVLARDNRDAPFRLRVDLAAGALAGALAIGDRKALVVGENGAVVVELP